MAPNRIDCGELQRLAAEIRERHDAVRVSYAARDAPGGCERWSDACRDFHESGRRMAAIVAPIRDGVRRDDADGIDAAIAYLECDVWHFRSGYLKQELMLALARAALDGAQRRSVAALVLALVDGPARLEFGAVATLARRTGGRTLRAGLRERIASPDHRVAHRALIVLIGLRHPRLTPDDMAVARDVVRAEMERHVGRRGTIARIEPPWVGRALRFVADVGWTAALLDEAERGDDMARWLMTRAPVVGASAAHEVLHLRLVEHLVREGPDAHVDFHPGCGLRLRDGAAMRTMLLGLADDGDQRVRHRAEAAWQLLDRG